MHCPRQPGFPAGATGGTGERADLGQRHFSFGDSMPSLFPPPASSVACEALAFLPACRVKKQQLQGPFCCLRSCDSAWEPGWHLNLNSCFVCLYARVQAPAPTPPPPPPGHGGDGLCKKGDPEELQLAGTWGRGARLWGRRGRNS